MSSSNKDGKNKEKEENNVSNENNNNNKNAKKIKINLDLIVCIHSFYYFKYENYPSICHKIWELMSSNNNSIFILSLSQSYNDNSNSDWLKMIELIVGHKFRPLQFIVQCFQLFQPNPESYTRTYVF